MKKLIFYILATFLFISSCSNPRQNNIVGLQTDSFKISINERGQISEIVDAETGINYLAQDTTAFVMSIRYKNEILPPIEAKFTPSTLILTFSDSIEARVRVDQKESHLVFELLSLSNDEMVDLIIWGPYPNTINKVIGETVGVVQGKEYSLGIQALNPKTLGGYPWQENDCLPQIDIFDQEDPSDMNEDGKRYVLYRVEAAKPAHFGSTLQAYCRKRTSDRVIENWNHKKYTAPSFDDGGYIGSKIALFGCPLSDILGTIEEIEITEDLPHPMIKGEWGKTSPLASSAYLIMGFGVNDIEKALEVTKKAGLRYLYHSGPFENWGHFKLKKDQFPNGIESMKPFSLLGMLIIMLMKLLTLLSQAMVMLSAPSALVKMLLY